MILSYTKPDPTLPIYKILHQNGAYLYAEGALQKLQDGVYSKPDILLQQRAENSSNLWKHIHTTYQRDYCLTVIPNYDCNLSCGYCFNKAHTSCKQLIDIEYVKTNARLVISNCIADNKTFHLVVTGGGEPTFHWELLQQIVREVKIILAHNPVESFFYLSTNAILLNKAKTRWIASAFDLIGLSCDGPELSNSQHLRNNLSRRNRKAFKKVCEVAGYLRLFAADYEVRITVLPEDFAYIPEIVYSTQRFLECDNIRIEPVYGIDYNENQYSEYASQFVLGYFGAKKALSALKANLFYSGVRMGEVHSTYCDIYRNVRRIFPINQINYCFLGKDRTILCDVLTNVTPNGETPDINTNLEAIKTFEHCHNCIAEYHCSRACPDFCWKDNTAPQRFAFKCSLNRQLAESFIADIIERNES
ncbi:MAG: 4Fe-4S cluster-binding domain-containing protein [Candidatus Cloacimonas sp.]|jgi:sulfatase maturation enzyme AslB (radical SAM superfamily)|nr:4Fe-4S cluster-binding domain-containing protein [Candidatus Cloacimonas sp.]